MMSDVKDELEPLPAEKLCNRSGKGNPIKGDGALGNEKKGRMYFIGKNKKELVKILQRMLKTLDYDLGTSGPDNDGVDGIFGNKTEKAVLDFQKKNTDWDGVLLQKDGQVGPRTADALNRAMVGKYYENHKWYDHYPTPKELVEGKPYHSVTSDFLRNGLTIEPETAKETKIFLVGTIPLIKTLKIRLFDVFHKPVKNAKYILNMADQQLKGVTNDEGILIQPIQGDVKEGKIRTSVLR